MNQTIKFQTEDGKIFEIDREPIEAQLMELVLDKAENIEKELGAFALMLKPFLKNMLGSAAHGKPDDVDIIEWASVFAVKEGLDYLQKEESLKIPSLREVTPDEEKTN